MLVSTIHHQPEEKIEMKIPRTHWASLKRDWTRSNEPCPKGLAYIDRVWKDNDGNFTERKLVGEGQLNNYIEEK